MEQGGKSALTQRNERKTKEFDRVLLVTRLRVRGNLKEAALSDRWAGAGPATKESENSCMGSRWMAQRHPFLPSDIFTGFIWWCSQFVV
jgi:hypothetical protein